MTRRFFATDHPSAKIAWEGDSLEVLKGFPVSVRIDLGAALRKLQEGEVPSNIRPMKSIGKGVFEVKDQDDKTWYRVIYLSKVEDTIYVLHSFEKDSAKTDRRDLEIAKRRLKDVQERLLAKKREEKHQKRNAH